VQLVRFFYKVDTQNKAKVLRKVCMRVHKYKATTSRPLKLRCLYA